MESTAKIKKKILVIEDDPLNFKIIFTFLKDSYDMEHVTSGEEALLLVIENHYDLFLTDIGLKQDMDGLEFTRRLRKIDKYKNSPVIALTAYALSGDKQRILEAGCSDYLSKPFTKNQLFLILKKF